ncbi:MAG: hypothetical protein CO183_02480 [Candidatus Zambryskibacteria bacterium CG_4_9_14_3_um_filter_42_9]|uniref:Uncharacterized protein n=1 Tax=Candidatus Zambryskibacteria bacterium CG22_combo_CG10-13_8_21_14_all_42_17 TaxID=1975118 RepID=A0A2H0BDH2_9BACT|nr:MAG: hypothetical protein COX06_01995 [Candidatus Zambryskibacteria bacterium CG22_combo_CG10-13_8_21_14_all_42_17]PJA36664.1 MAG: hypothetical protein CO183_02480 [Candidatus Zambryskibacteria bacterium CG_4_9_14_3_um_filter_42_9]
MKNFLIGIVLLIILLAGATWWSKSLQSEDPGVISRSGLHWHPQLTIYVRGEKQEIPANIGIGMQYASTPTFDQGMRMTAMHTHEPDGTIHFEFPARVTREDTKLKNFFAIWGRNMMSFGSSVTMMVNGEETAELGEYEMKDGDKIELRYE